MMLVTADTNLLASGVARRNPDAAPAQFIDAWRAGRLTLLLSEHILAELARTLSLPYFQRHVTPAQAAAFIALLRSDALIVAITATVHGAATHPEDDLVLATALSGQVEYLVTGDTKLQRLGSYAGMTIASPRAFVDIILPGLPQDR